MTGKASIHRIAGHCARNIVHRCRVRLGTELEFVAKIPTSNHEKTWHDDGVTAGSLMAALLLLLQFSSDTVAALNLQADNTSRIVVFIPFTDQREGPEEEVADEGVEYYGYGVTALGATANRSPRPPFRCLLPLNSLARTLTSATPSLFPNWPALRIVPSPCPIRRRIQKRRRRKDRLGVFGFRVLASQRGAIHSGSARGPDHERRRPG